MKYYVLSADYNQMCMEWVLGVFDSMEALELGKKDFLENIQRDKPELWEFFITEFDDLNQIKYEIDDDE